MATQLNNSIIRSFAVLELFSEERPELTAAAVADALDMNAVTAHRILRTLEAVGAVVAPRRGVYRLGYRLVDLAERAGSDVSMALRLQPILNDLTELANESAMATRFEGRYVLCIATALSRRPFTFNARVGHRMETHATANGKLWLAELDETALQLFLDTVPRDALSENTLVAREALMEDIRAIRSRGYAVNDRERESDLRAVAMPVRNAAGRMIAGMSVFGPSNRFDRVATERAVGYLQIATERARQSLYGLPGELQD